MDGAGGTPAAPEIARSVLGILGNMASCLFFLSSAPTIIHIVRLKSSGGLSGNLYVFKLFNCLLWAFYGLPVVHPHDFWVVLTNSFGCGFALLYMGPYLFYATRSERLSMLWRLFTIISIFIIMVVLLLTIDHSQHNRILVVGILCTIISSAMHMTLLSQCGLALQSKEIFYLQPTSSIAAFVKGAVWTTYGLVNLDIFIVIPNGIGVLIGVIQAIMLVILIKDKKRKEDPSVIISGQNDGFCEGPKVRSRRNSSQVAPIDTIDPHDDKVRSRRNSSQVAPIDMIDSRATNGLINVDLEAHQVNARVPSSFNVSLSTDLEAHQVNPR